MTQLKSIAQRTYAYSWASLFLLYPFIFFITPERAVVLVWLPLLAGWRWLAHGRPIPKTPFNMAIGLLVMMVAVSAWATPDFAFSLPKIAGLLFGIAVFYTVVDAASESNARLGMTTLLLLLMAGGLTLIGFVSFYPPFASRLPFSLEVNPNEVSGILTYSWPLLFALMVGQLVTARKQPQRKQIAHWLAAAVMAFLLLIGLVILYLTTSRGGQLGCLVSVGLVLVLATRRFRPIMLTLSLITLLTAGVLLFRSGSTDMTVKHANASLTASVAGRTEIWLRAVQGIQDFPATGMGMNMFRRVMPALYPMPGAAAEVDFAHAHNHLLQAALDLGILGLLAYLLIWAIVAWQLVNVWLTCVTPQHRFLALGLAAALLAHFTYGVTDAIALGAKPGFLLWILFGLAAALPNRLQSPSPAPPR